MQCLAENAFTVYIYNWLQSRLRNRGLGALSHRLKKLQLQRKTTFMHERGARTA